MSDRAQSLRQMKRRATGLLVLALAVFVVARIYEDDHGWLGYVRATAEAAMVGGLADWFAVTALFRHPLGLRIPHTAIVRTRKDQLGRSLGEFVQQNFLASEVVIDKFRRADVTPRIARWLTAPDNADAVARHATTVLAGAFDVLDDDEISDLLTRAVTERLRSVDTGPLASRALEVATADGRHHQLVDAAARGALRFVDERRGELRARFGRESPWWVPEPIDDRIFEKLHSGLQRFLQELIDDPDHELRRHFDDRLAELAERLRTDPALAARADRYRDELLDQPAVQSWIASLWADLKQSVLDQSADPNSGLRTHISRWAISFGESLERDAALRAKIDQWIESALRYVIEANRHEVAELIETTVAKWDADEAADRIELQVGRDLQFIRINGTVVGGLAGLVIYSLAQLL